MVLSPEDDDEDETITVPPPGDPQGDVPLVMDEESIDDLASSSSDELSTPLDPDEGPPFEPPAWDEASDVALSDDEDDERFELLSLVLLPPEEEVPSLGDDDDEVDVPSPDDLLEDLFDPHDDDDEHQSENCLPVLDAVDQAGRSTS